MLEKLRSRVAILAAAMLPLAHLTSLGVMEASGFILLIASAGLFAVECRFSPSVAVNRVRSGAALPIIGYAVFSLLSIGVMLDQASDQIAALRELKWALCIRSVWCCGIDGALCVLPVYVRVGMAAS
jgi:hypothetical protein